MYETEREQKALGTGTRLWCVEQSTEVWGCVGSSDSLSEESAEPVWQWPALPLVPYRTYWLLLSAVGGAGFLVDSKVYFCDCCVTCVQICTCESIT